MKKLYSIVLMATALLVSTNVKAVDVATFEALQTAITDAPAATLTAITLTDDISATAQIDINGGKNVEINLNNHEISSNSRIVVDNGQLTLKGNGTLTSSTIPIDMRGSYADVANYSVVTVENGVNVVAVQHYVGHVDAATTLNIYTDCQKEFMKESFGLKVSKKYHDIFAENLHGKSEKQIGNQPMNIVENYYFQESTTMIPAFERR